MKNQDETKIRILNLNIPGYEAEFTPNEAEDLGAFEEDALSENDAKESSIDLIDNEEKKDGNEKDLS